MPGIFVSAANGTGQKATIPPGTATTCPLFRSASLRFRQFPTGPPFSRPMSVPGLGEALKYLCSRRRHTKGRNRVRCTGTLPPAFSTGRRRSSTADRLSGSPRRSGPGILRHVAGSTIRHRNGPSSSKRKARHGRHTFSPFLFSFDFTIFRTVTPNDHSE